MADYLVKGESLTDIADKIRAKTGDSSALTFPADFEDAIDDMVVPSGNQDITTTDEYDVSAKATARISATERGKIIAENIKKDVTLLGVTGSYEGTDTTDATAYSSDILFGKTAYARGNKLTGIILSQAAQTITPTTSDQTIPSGKYLTGAQTIKGDANLVAGNIKKDINIFGVTGSYEGSDTSDATATSGDILDGKTAYAGGVKITGNIPTRTASDLAAIGAIVSVPYGYYASTATKSVDMGSVTINASTRQINPNISVNSSGLVESTVTGSFTPTATVTSGYVSTYTSGQQEIGGYSSQQLSTQAAQTITPTTSDQTISSGKYLTGTQTIKGDANLVAGNIKKDVTLFGVTGTYEGGGGGGLWEEVDLGGDAHAWELFVVLDQSYDYMGAECHVTIGGQTYTCYGPQGQRMIHFKNVPLNSTLFWGGTGDIIHWVYGKIDSNSAPSANSGTTASSTNVRIGNNLSGVMFFMIASPEG